MPVLTLEQQKENLSFGYLQTVCSVAGVSVVPHKDDGDGIDGSLKYRTETADVALDFQLKSTSVGSTLIRDCGDRYSYSLKLKNYRDLQFPSLYRKYLFLLVLPEDFNDSVECAQERLVVRKCMFWLELSNAPDVAPTTKTAVDVPKSNVVSPEWLKKIMFDIAEEL